MADIDAQLGVHTAEMDMMKAEGWQGHFNADIKVITAAIGRKTTKTTEGQRTHARAHARGRTHTHTHTHTHTREWRKWIASASFPNDNFVKFENIIKCM